MIQELSCSQCGKKFQTTKELETPLCIFCALDNSYCDWAPPDVHEEKKFKLEIL